MLFPICPGFTIIMCDRLVKPALICGRERDCCLISYPSSICIPTNQISSCPPCLAKLIQSPAYFTGDVVNFQTSSGVENVAQTARDERQEADECREIALQQVTGGEQPVKRLEEDRQYDLAQPPEWLGFLSLAFEHLQCDSPAHHMCYNAVHQ